MIPTRSQIRSTSARTWVEKITVGARPELRDEFEQVAPSRRVERADRLVEDQEARCRDERLRDPEALAHPARIGADPPPGRVGQPDALASVSVAPAPGLGGGQALRASRRARRARDPVIQP